jgi:hypothetical protein
MKRQRRFDDSDGEFGTFAGGLYCGWIAANFCGTESG